MTIQIRRTATPDNPPVDLAPGQLSVEMATDPPRLWCGVPTSIDPGGRVEVAISGSEDVGDDYTTGDAKLTLQAQAEPGWILMDDGTIGDSASGATTRANADTEALFTLIWNHAFVGLQESNGNAVGAPGWGASAAADFAAHRRLLIPRTAGRAPIIAGQGVGLTIRALGQAIGEDSHVQIGAELPQHNHDHGDPAHSHTGVATATAINNGYHWFPQWSTELTFFNWYSYTDGSVTVAWGGTGISLANNGSSNGLNVTQPSAAWNILLKL